MKKMRVTALLGVALLALAGCGSSSDEASLVWEQASPQVDAAYDAEQPSVESAGSTEAADEREVVTTGSLTLVPDDSSTAMDEIVALIERAGGRVDGRSEQTATEWQEASAWLTVRVPAGELTDTIAEVEKLGDVTDVSINSDDVTRQGRDLDARIKALEASTERLLDLMTDADSSEALIAAEDALSERQADLESLRSERTYLSDQVTMSTLEVSVVSERVVEFKSDGFVGGLKSGWHSLVTFASAALVGIGAALPWVVVIGVPVTVVILLLRRRRLRGRRPQASFDRQ